MLPLLAEKSNPWEISLILSRNPLVDLMINCPWELGVDIPVGLLYYDPSKGHTFPAETVQSHIIH